VTIFDLERGREGRDDGIELVEVRHENFVEEIRAALKVLSRSRPVSADDARRIAVERGLEAPNKYVWGAIFAGRGWVKVGTMASRVVTNHAHVNPLWRWHGE
jgi:hypothetical protein